MAKENSSHGINPHAIERGLSGDRHLLELDRTGWAWEWLRRNGDFIAAASEMLQDVDHSVVPLSPDVFRVEQSTLVRWGVLFCRPVWLPHLLVAGAQPTRPHC